MNDEKIYSGCLGSGWSGKACAATKRVWMLTKKAEKFTKYSLSTVQTLFIISGLSRNIENHFTVSQNHIPVCLKPYGLLRLQDGFKSCLQDPKS